MIDPKKKLIITIVLAVLLFSLSSIGKANASETDIATPSESFENLTITINPDATIKLSGTLEAVFNESPGAYGNADFYIKAIPSYEESKLKEFQFTIKGSGEFFLEEPVNGIAGLELSLDTKQKGAESNGTIDFNLLTDEAGGKGKVTITTTTENNTMTMNMKINLDLNTQLDEETVTYIKKQLQQLTPEALNLGIIQSGMTFLKITKLDFSGLEISTSEVKGNAVIEMQMNMDDYLTWYKGMLYNQGLSQEEIENSVGTIQKLFDNLYNPQNTAKLKLNLKLQNTNLDFDFEYTGQLTGDTVNAYIDYFQTIMNAPNPMIGNQTIGMEENIYIGTQTNLTIAMKPIDITVNYTATKQESRLKVQINSLYLKEKDIDLGYEGAIKALHELAAENATMEEPIEQLTILVTPYENKAPTLKLEKPINGDIIKEEPDIIVLENVMPTELKKIQLEDVPKVTTTPIETSEQTETTTPQETVSETTQTTTSQTKMSTELIAGIVIVIAIAVIAGFVLKR